MTLREPPKRREASRIAGRFIGLLVLLAVFALVVWTAATNQQAQAVERADPAIVAPGEFVAVAGGSVHFRSFGDDGPVTVFVHPDTVAGGSVLGAIAEQLGEERRAIVPDLFGFGFSSRPTNPGRLLSTTGQAETLAAFLEERELTAVDLVGFGWGGEVAVEVAATRPELVRSLVLVDTPSLPVPEGDDHRWEAMPLGVGTAFAYTFEGAGPRAEARFLAECPSWGRCDEQAFREAATVPGTSRSIWARRASSPAMVATSRLDSLTVPVTVVAVDVGRVAAEELASRFPDAEMVAVEADGLAEVLSGNQE